MPYDKDQKLSPEESPENREGQGGNKPENRPQEEKYSFLQETIKPKPISGEKLIKQFARIAVYGVILGAFSCLGFFALKPWAENWFRGNPETVTIPEDEEPAEEDQAAEEEEEPAVPELDAKSYEEINESMYSLAQEAAAGIVTVSRAEQAAD
ncbi:MAG TPA: trypsin, partial [Candidatus Mediterraneibacter excrementigallinarum]|nr:trypsin [Candidatus Mediterraneibacter excrementigallinarum]